MPATGLILLVCRVYYTVHTYSVCAYDTEGICVSVPDLYVMHYVILSAVCLRFAFCLSKRRWVLQMRSYPFVVPLFPHLTPFNYYANTETQLYVPEK